MCRVVFAPLPAMSVQSLQVSPASVLSRYWYASTATVEAAAVHARSTLRMPAVAVKPLGASTGGACVVARTWACAPAPSEFTARTWMS